MTQYDTKQKYIGMLEHWANHFGAIAFRAADNNNEVKAYQALYYWDQLRVMLRRAEA